MRVSLQTLPLLVAYPLRDSFRAWCEHCLDVVHALEHESVMRLLKVSAKTFFDLLENGSLHTIEIEISSSLICGNSLSNDPCAAGNADGPSALSEEREKGSCSKDS
jgi:hypothetical protein